MRAKALDHVVIEVRDIDRALAFYCESLGLEAERLAEFRAGRVPFPSVRVGTGLIDLFASETPGAGPHHFCVEVDEDPEAVTRWLEQRGVAYEQPGTRFGARGDGFSVYVTDPDGHRIEVRTYRRS